jgi:hypothetical protein
MMPIRLRLFLRNYKYKMIRCNGTGCSIIEYEPFTERKRRTDIDKVMLSSGSFLLNCGPCGDNITYDEFINGKIPTVEE